MTTDIKAKSIISLVRLKRIFIAFDIISEGKYRSGSKLKLEYSSQEKKLNFSLNSVCTMIKLIRITTATPKLALKARTIMAVNNAGTNKVATVLARKRKMEAFVMMMKFYEVLRNWMFSGVLRTLGYL